MEKKLKNNELEDAYDAFDDLLAENPGNSNK